MHNLLFILGLLALVAGTWGIYPPTGLVLAGILLVFVAFALDARPGPKHEQPRQQ